MNQRFTPEDLFRGKLTDTPVPDWKQGWNALEPLLEAAEAARPSRTPVWRKRLSAAAAIALLAGLAAWWMYGGSAENPSGASPRTVISVPEEIQGGVPLKTGPAEGDPAEGHPDQLPPVESLTVAAYPGTPGTIQAIADTTVGKVSASAPLYGDQAAEALSYTPASLSNAPLRSAPLLISRSPVPAELPLMDKNLVREPAQDIIHRSSSAGKGLPVPMESPAPVATVRAKEQSSPGYYVAVRLNANGASSFGHAASNFSPVLKGTPVDVYPAVMVGRHFSGGKFSLQAGLAVASPVDVQKEGLNRSVSDPVRAMRANVSQSDDSMNLSRLYYVDVPLTVQYHLNKKFSVGSGLQLSVLEKVIGEKQRLDYNTAGYVAMALPESPEPENLTHAKSVSGTISPVDLRWVIGLYYQAGKHWNASLQYQCGLTDISNNRAFLSDHVNRNNIIRAGIGFVIK